MDFIQKCSAGLRSSIAILAFVVINMSCGPSLRAYEISPERHEDARALGIHLEKRFWNLVYAHDARGLNKIISPVFQGVSPFGIDNKYTKITELLNSTMQGFVLKHVHVKKYLDFLVITYRFEAAGSNLTDGNTISTWKKVGSHWKMVSHSFFPTLP